MLSVRNVTINTQNHNVRFVKCIIVNIVDHFQNIHNINK